MQESYLLPEQCTAKKLTEDLSKLAANMVILLKGFRYTISYKKSNINIE